MMQDLTKDELYTVWLDGTTRLFCATGAEIQAIVLIRQKEQES